MRLAYDLHIHTALSPCADNDMTPNNIVNMSLLKGLDIIAITDHNSCANAEACTKCAENKPLMVIPGIEVETSEEIHVICLFPDIQSALQMQQIIYSRLPSVKNNERIFGKQLILNEEDELVSTEERLLLTSAALTINELFDIVHNTLYGCAIPAHIDRQANSLLTSFGAIPEDINISCVEISHKYKEELLTEKYPQIKSMRKMYSSDAHYLGDISEPGNFLDIDVRSVKSVIGLLRKGLLIK